MAKYQQSDWLSITLSSVQNELKRNHLLTADIYTLVRPVLTVWLPITVPSLWDTLAILTHKVCLRTSLSNCRGRERERVIHEAQERQALCSLIKSHI